MNLSDLLGAAVTDADGAPLGRVRDVRLVQDGPIQGTFGAGLRLHGLIVGPVAFSSRLGYGRLGGNRPWLVAAAAERFARGSRFVPWTEVTRLVDREVVLACRADQLSRPTPLAHHRGTDQ